MNKNRSQKIAINGILISLMILFTFSLSIPGLPISIAFLPLIVLVVGSIMQGFGTALLLGFVFGLFSMVNSYISPSPLAPIFQNPLISILPRVFIGVLGLCVFKVVEKVLNVINKKAKKPLNDRVCKIISSAFCSAFTVFFNTLLVLSMIWILFAGDNINGTVISKEFIFGLITLNFLLEIVVTTLIAPPIVYAVDKFLKGHNLSVVTQADLQMLDSAENMDNNINELEQNFYQFDNIDNSSKVGNNINTENSDNK